MAGLPSDYFRNRVFAVAGGGSGIGLATVKQLIGLGARVSLADYKLTSSLENDIGGGERNLILSKVDVTNVQEVETWMQDTILKWGRLDGAANLAGIVAKDHNFGTLLTTTDDDWLRVFDVNIHGTKNCVREQIKYIGKGYLPSFDGERVDVGMGNPRAEGGSIVNTGSTLAVAGTAGTAAYAASKHAVLGLTRCVAKEVGPKGTRVNCINP
jgi:NAD(P)-dependent dehydrogenase (short-subunit alcohol dehydrogenase family)